MISPPLMGVYGLTCPPRTRTRGKVLKKSAQPGPGVSFGRSADEMAPGAIGADLDTGPLEVEPLVIYLEMRAGFDDLVGDFGHFPHEAVPSTALTEGPEPRPAVLVIDAPGARHAAP